MYLYNQQINTKDGDQHLKMEITQKLILC
jgi:hypothetical protein